MLLLVTCKFERSAVETTNQVQAKMEDLVARLGFGTVAGHEGLTYALDTGIRMMAGYQHCVLHLTLVFLMQVCKRG